MSATWGAALRRERRKACGEDEVVSMAVVEEGAPSHSDENGFGKRTVFDDTAPATVEAGRDNH